MTTKACWWRLWVLCLVLISAETKGQETLWEANQSAGVKVLQEGRSLELEDLFWQPLHGPNNSEYKTSLRLAQSLNDLGMLYTSQGK